MCDSCDTIDNIKLDCIIQPILDLSPQLEWLFNGYLKFRSQLPDDVVSELETQLSTLAKNVATSSYKISFLTTIITYILLFLVVLFIFICIIYNNETLTYIMMAISLILIIAAGLFILYYSYDNINTTAKEISSATTQLKTLFTDAIDAGLCCINGANCGTFCTSSSEGCQCRNTPNITYTVVNSGLNVTFTNTTATDTFPLSKIPLSDLIWSFGDGTTASGLNNTTITHTYLQQGTYNTTLTLVLRNGSSFICAFPVVSPVTQITLV